MLETLFLLWEVMFYYRKQSLFIHMNVVHPPKNFLSSCIASLFFGPIDFMRLVHTYKKAFLGSGKFLQIINLHSLNIHGECRPCVFYRWGFYIYVFYVILLITLEAEVEETG